MALAHCRASQPCMVEGSATLVPCMPSTAARVNYPELPDPLTPGDVQRLFSPSYSERGWAPTIARRPESQVVLLVHLKIFQTIGRFLPATQIPPAVVERVAHKMGSCASRSVLTSRLLGSGWHPGKAR